MKTKKSLYKNVALIPARSGSKGLPGKNIKELINKPLIAYSIETCIDSDSIDRVIVSTDDIGIAEISKKYGAEVPFLRPENLSGDQVGDRSVMLHLIDYLKENENYHFDNLIYIRPTTPFKTVSMLEEAISKIENNKYSSVRSVTKSEGVFHPYWMFKKNNEMLESFINDLKIENFYQRQQLPECYRLNGVVDISRVKTILNNNNIYGNSIGYIEIPEKNSIDIDTEFDLLLCEFILKKELL
jgi:N-acylneuraminate cytidylyltransferase/CMP-N,N'-diacetyllegionaminic acid synthase